MNNVTIEVYSSGSTRIVDQDGNLIKAQNLRFATNYPGGLYGDASFYIPKDVVAYLPIKGTYRVVFRNGLKIVYEGWVTSLESNLQDTEQGITVNCLGAWGYTAMRRHWRKIWADQRLTDDIWIYNTSAGAANVCSVDRQGRLRFVPKAEGWTSGNAAEIRYNMPTSQTVKRMVYDCVLQEGTQAWEIGAYRSTDGTTYYLMGTARGDTFDGTATTTAITSTGTSSIDVTLATASQYVSFRYYARDNQTPAGANTYYGQFSGITVYSETGTITATEIVKDIHGTIAEINSDTSYIDTTDVSIVPYVVDRWTTIADIMTEVAGFGDSSFDSWASGFYDSEKATTPNGEPVLFLEEYPALTDYDYAVRLDEPNVVPPFSIVQDFGEIYNIVIVEYQDENGNTQQLTPWNSGYGGLEDSTSEAAYGDRAYILNVGSSTAAAAYSSGQRFLAQYKDPQWRVEGPITVLDYIRGAGGQRIPVSEIRAGKRVKIENYLQNLSGTGLTFLISHTEYDDDANTCSISIGPPSDLVYPRYVFERPQPADQVPATTSAGGGGDSNVERLNWKRQYGLVPGTPEWNEAVKLGKKAWLEKYSNKKRAKK